MITWSAIETRHGRYHVAAKNGDVVVIKLPGTDVTELFATLQKLFPGEEASATMDSVLVDASAQLQEYADGIRSEFTFPVAFHGTSFQEAVWKALADIPYGETRSYADVAAAIGKPAAARAVGGANRANHLPIVVPCHRVIAADGGLGGYMGQWGEGNGLGLKGQLLALERASA